ncbi:uncharacterized protein LOC144632875 [Oculina patagonica]
MDTSSHSFIKLIFILVLHFESVFTACMEHDNQIQGYLISTEPPYDNYYNISKAVYPSVDLPSLMIDITVTFLTTADNSTSTLSASFPTSANGSTTSKNNSKQNGSDSYSYMWSMSCLYVSGGNISLSSMTIFSLGAIWPNRRARKLYITLPQFCSGSPSDPHQENTMLYFLSTLQDTAVVGSLHDPRINTAECVISGQEKALHFTGLKRLLHGVCWGLLFISLVMSLFVSQAIVVQLGEWDKEQVKEQNLSKLAAVMFFSLFVFVVGVFLNIYACKLSTVQQDLYAPVFLGFVLLVLFRRVIWCIYIHCRRNTTCTVCICDCSLTSGHGEETSNNFVSCFFLYPAVFMACHHLLWVLLGIITEPFWGITILVGVVAISAAFYLLVCEFHSAYFSPRHPSDEKPKRSLEFMIFMFDFILFLSAFLAFVLLLFVFLVIAQAFLSESLISTIVQNGLVTVVTLWLAYLKFDTGTVEKKEQKKEEEVREGERGEVKKEEEEGDKRGRRRRRRRGGQKESLEVEELVEVNDGLEKKEEQEVGV